MEWKFNTEAEIVSLSLKDDGTFIFSTWRYTPEHNFKKWDVNYSGSQYSVFEDKFSDEEIAHLLGSVHFKKVDQITFPNLSDKLYGKLLFKNIYKGRPTIRLYVLYIIEMFIVRLFDVNKCGWLLVGIFKKRRI